MSVSSASQLLLTEEMTAECKVCKAPARYSYYGAVVCQSCKIFFRRNAEHKQRILKCQFGNKCRINRHNRHLCRTCRLNKCFEIGMCTEKIRPCRPKKGDKNQEKSTMINSSSSSKNLLIPYNKKQPEQIHRLNLLQSDTSTLTIDQWNLLSNLIHCFDEHSKYKYAENFIQYQNTLPVKCRFKYLPVTEFFQTIMNNVQLVFEKNRDFLRLSSNDRSILLRTTVEYTTSIGGMFIMYQHRVFDYPSFYRSSEMIFRPLAATFTKSVLDHLDPDNTFIKLILAALAFSTINYTVYTECSTSNLLDSRTIVSIQDMYTELAWKYLLYRCSYYDAVIRLTNLIKCLFSANKAIVEAHESQQFNEMIGTVVKQTEHLLFL